MKYYYEVNGVGLLYDGYIPDGVCTEEQEKYIGVPPTWMKTSVKYEDGTFILKAPYWLRMSDEFDALRGKIYSIEMFSTLGKNCMLYQRGLATMRGLHFSDYVLTYNGVHFYLNSFGKLIMESG